MQRHIYFILEREASKMPRRDRIRDEIVAFAERQDWIVRKADGGYSIYKEPGKPIARCQRALKTSQRWALENQPF